MLSTYAHRRVFVANKSEGVEKMTESMRAGLYDAGCAADLVERYAAFEEAGDIEGCLALLRSHRLELICAMHEAQRPVDVCDWVIRNLEKEQRHAAC